MIKGKFHTIVIGAGSGGLTISLGLASAGKKVLLIEKGFMGGDCTNFGCVPSKRLISIGKKVGLMRENGAKNLSKIVDSALDRTQEIVEHIRAEESPSELMKKYHNLTVVRGEASFQDKHHVEVKNGKSKDIYCAKNIVIATGSEPRVIKIDGVMDDDLLTNKTIFNVKDIPENLIIVGGGVIACELGQAFANLGSNVTLVVRGDRLLKNSEQEISDMVFEDLKDKGIKVYFESSIDSVGGKNALVGKHKVKFDKILLAAGRVVDVSSLGLENAGVEYNKRGISTDGNNRTNVRNIYAVGDVSSTFKLTHNADNQGRDVVKKLLIPISSAKRKAMPRVVFMEKEVAEVGLSYKKAIEKYNETEVVKITMQLEMTDRAKTDNESGVMVVVAKALTGKILGASIYGPHAGEMISTFTVAIDNKISIWKLSNSIYAYPTYGRIFKKLGDQFLRWTLANWKNETKHLLKSKGPKLIGLLFWISIFVGFSKYKSVNDLSNLDLAKNLYNFITGTTYGPLLYIAVYALRPIIFFPATLLTLLSGALFGFWQGVLFTILGENMSANFAYFLGRVFGKDILPEDGVGLLSKWQEKVQKRGFESVLIMRFIYLPFDAVNYGCGILRVKWREYFLATMIGIMPGLMAFIGFGASIENIDSFDPSQFGLDKTQLAIAVGIFVASLVLAKFVRKKTGNK